MVEAGTLVPLSEKEVSGDDLLWPLLAMDKGGLTMNAEGEEERRGYGLDVRFDSNAHAIARACIKPNYNSLMSHIDIVFNTN